MSCPTTVVDVRACVGASPGYRNSANLLFADVSDGVCEVVLDFTGVVFISRGFADELHQERLSMQRDRNVAVTIENANADIVATLAAVARTQEGTVQPRSTERVFRIDSRNGLEDLLLNP
jgi:hypothetical protein